LISSKKSPQTSLYPEKEYALLADPMNLLLIAATLVWLLSGLLTVLHLRRVVVVGGGLHTYVIIWGLVMVSLLYGWVLGFTSH
jgi:hypothetical protein